MPPLAKLVSAAVLGLLFAGCSQTAPPAAPPGNRVIKGVMKDAFSNQLVNRAADGQASGPELQKLVGLFQQLATQVPAKGDEASWKAKTAALLSAAKDAAAKKPDAGARLKAAAECAACHTVHR